MWKRLVSFLLMKCFLCMVYSQPNEPGGWHQFGDFIYRVETVAANYTQALNGCQDFEATLAMVESQAKTKFVADLINDVTHGRGGYWIGLNDLNTEDIYRWPDGSRLYGKGQFPYDQPDRNERHPCVTVVADPSSVAHAEWEDKPCGDVYGYVCSKREAAYMGDTPGCKANVVLGCLLGVSIIVNIVAAVIAFLWYKRILPWARFRRKRPHRTGEDPAERNRLSREVRGSSLRRVGGVDQHNES